MSLRKNVSTSERLTEGELHVLEYILQCVCWHGFPPTIRELCKHFGWKSTNTATGFLYYLERKGRIAKEGRGKGRTIRIVGIKEWRPVWYDGFPRL